MTRESKGSIAGRGSARRRKAAPPVLSPPLRTVPPLCPAALEPFWSRGKLILPQNSAESDRESVVVAASFKLLHGKISALVADAVSPAVDQRSIGCLQSVAARIPNYTPVQDELFYLAHVRGFLEDHAKTFGANWTEPFVKRFADMMLHFDHTMRQFPKWRAFVSNAEKDRLTPEEAAGVAALANGMVAALHESDAHSLISPAISSALDVFKSPLQSGMKRSGQQKAGAGEASKLLLVHDLYCSIENITKRLAEAILKTQQSLGFDAQRVLNEDVEPAHPWMVRTLLKILQEVPSFALEAKFHWLASLADGLRFQEEPSSNSAAVPEAGFKSPSPSKHCAARAGRSVSG